MIVNDLNVSSLAFNPLEADAPLVVDANAVLPRPLPFQFLKTVARRGKQVLKILGVIQVNQFTASRALDVLGQLSRRIAKEDLVGFVRGERFDHETIISRRDNIIKFRLSSWRSNPAASSRHADFRHRRGGDKALDRPDDFSESLHLRIVTRALDDLQLGIGYPMRQ
jgi:hypothetical protein